VSALRELLAVFGTEFDDKGIKDGERGIGGLKKTLGEFGTVLAEAFAIKEIVEFGREILEQADVLAKQSQALSVSAAELQGWQFAAKLSGSSAEEFNAAFTKFNRNVAEAAKGTGPAAAAFKSLGVNIKDSTGKVGQPIELLDGVADGLVAMQDPAKRTEAIMALFGKSGARLLPLFLEGADGIKKLRAEVKELGAEFDESFLEDAQEVNDNVDRLKTGFRGLAIQGLKPLLPLIVEWTHEGVGLIKQIVAITKNSNAMKAALVAFGTYGVVKTISGFTELARKAGFLKNGLSGLLFELLPLVAAFLVLEDVWTFFTGGDSETEDLLNRFFGAGAADKVKAFADALKNDIGPAFSEVLAIFTDGKPLDTKFRELDAYVEGILGPQFKSQFGEMADSMLTLVEAAASLAETLADIVKAVRWLGSHTIDAIGWLGFQASDAIANEDARTARRAEDDQTSSSDRILNFLQPERAILANGTSSARATAPSQNLGNIDAQTIRGLFGAPQVGAQTIRDLLAAAPAQQAAAAVPSYFAPPAVSQSIQAPITQNFYGVDTPADAGRAAAKGAKDGVSEGVNLRTLKALVPAPKAG
jgi:hypothetical protein